MTRTGGAIDYCPAGKVAAVENNHKPCGKKTDGQAITCPQTLAVLPTVALCRAEDWVEARGFTIESHSDSSDADVRLRPPKT